MQNIPLKINHFKQFLFLLWCNNTHLLVGGRVHWPVAAFRRMSKIIEKAKKKTQMMCCLVYITLHKAESSERREPHFRICLHKICL